MKFWFGSQVERESFELKLRSWKLVNIIFLVVKFGCSITKMNYTILFFCAIVLLALLKEVKCLHKRCIRCRSRGELGSCADPLPFNVTDPDAEPGIHVVACPSGWCGKMNEGNTGAFRSDDYGSATERMCLQRPPSDYEERCAYTLWNYKKVYMCFCNGDLCNSGFRMSMSYLSIFGAVLITIFNI